MTSSRAIAIVVGDAASQVSGGGFAAGVDADAPVAAAAMEKDRMVANRRSRGMVIAS